MRMAQMADILTAIFETNIGKIVLTAFRERISIRMMELRD